MLIKKPRLSDAVVAVLAALTAVSLAACGGSLSPTGATPFIPEAGAPTVILSQVFEDVEMGEQRATDFSLPAAGTLVLTVRWNDQYNTVIAVLTGAGCSSGRDRAAPCEERRSVDRQAREGREGVIDYVGARGAYHLVVENEGPSRESIRVTAELVLATGAPVLPDPHPSDRP